MKTLFSQFTATFLLPTVLLVAVASIQLAPTLARAETRNCPLTKLVQMGPEDKPQIIVYCNEFMGPLQPGANIYSLFTRQPVDIANVELPVDAVLTTRIIRRDEVVVSIGIGNAADPNKILYK